MKRFDWPFVVRTLIAWLFVYFAVWRESKIAMTIILVGLMLGVEIFAWIVDQLWRRRR